jgi:subtilase family serine protease
VLGKQSKSGRDPWRWRGAASAGLALALAGLVLPSPADAASVERRVHRPHLVRSEATAAGTGLSPAQVKAVYAFPTALNAGTGRTVAVVAPYDAPTIENDLNGFSRRYGLPACTTTNGCFRKVDQKGAKNYPTKNKLWAMEISLDVEWVHAIAPGAKILLVEARSDRLGDVVAAEDYATGHAAYVSNSLGLEEFAGESAYDGHFHKPGVSIFAASGDDGAGSGPGYPASSPYVVAVGGTTLADVGLPSFGETGWRGSGGGCSVYESAGPAQRTWPGYGAVNCAGKRATPDVSLVADPQSGVAVYDSYKTAEHWMVLGGTSLSTPIWAARAAISGLAVDAGLLYSASSPIALRDITAGSNGLPALPGFDLVTGLGSWTGATP